MICIGLIAPGQTFQLISYHVKNMTSPTFRNSQLGNTIRTEKPSLFVGSSGIVFTDGSQQLTAFTGTATESDPIFTSSTAYSITATDTGNWNTSFSWGDHASIGYATTGELVAVSGYLQNQINNIPEDTNTFISGVIYNDSSRKIILLRNDNIALTGDLSSVLQSGDPISLLNNDLAYITGFTETDPIFSTSVAYNISATQTGEWSLAYGWGNHASFDYATNSGLVVVSGYLQNQIDNISDIYVTGITFNSGDGNLTLYLNNATNLSDNFDGRYLQSYTETDPTISGYIKTITSLQISQWDESYSVLAAQSGNWNAAHSWGDHANVGYLQSGDNISLLNNDIGYLTAADVSGIAGNGTTNYISKWSSSNSLTDSVIYDDGTNVGIGTASPLSKLYVRDTTDSDCQITVDNGTARAKLQTLSNIGYAGTITDHDFILRANNTDSIKLSNSSANNIVVVNPVANDQDFRVRGTTETNLIYADADTNNVGIGIGVPTQRLHVYEAGNAQVLVDDGTVKTKVQSLAGQSKGIVGTNSNHDLEFRTNNNGKMIIKAGGDVGIGTATPQAKLDVNGTVEFDDLVRWEYPDKILDTNIGTLGYLRLYDEIGAGAGICGMGVSTSSFNVGTSGAINLRFVTDAVERIIVESNGNTVINELGHPVNFRVEGDADQNLLFVQGAGGADKVGIGTASPSQKLHVIGNTKIEGNQYVVGDFITLTSPSSNTSAVPTIEIKGIYNSVDSDTLKLAAWPNYAMIGNESTTPLNIQTLNSQQTRFGIGTQSSPGIVFYDGSNGVSDNDTGFWHPSSNNIGISTAGLERLRIDSSGNIGIGTATPSEKLDVSGGIGHVGWKTFRYTDTAGPNGSSNGFAIKLNDAHGTTLNTNYHYRIRLTTNNTGSRTGATYLVWYSSVTGSWIAREVSWAGSTSNHCLLTISGSNAIAYTNHPSTSYPINCVIESYFTNNQYSLADSMGSDYQWQRYVDTLYYNDGNVGVGTSASVTSRFQVEGGDVAFNQNNGSNIFKVGSTASDNLLYVDGTSNDKVGIGTASPAYKLDVAGSGSFDALNINDQFTFPTTDGSSGQGLITDGLGDLSWNNVIISDTTAASGSDVINNIISLTQEEYDAITPQSGTLYAISSSGSVVWEHPRSSYIMSVMFG